MNIVYAILVLGVLGGLFGLALAYAAKVFYVKVDEREEQINEVLPGANCGGCGFAGCGGCAAAIVAGRAPVGSCVPGGNATAAKVADIMGVAAEVREKEVAFVRCSSKGLGGKYEYAGVQDCLAATLAGSNAGPKLCAQGCLGFGSCVAACRFDAIHVVDGVAKVDPEVCTGCGMCKDTCPKHIITMVPYGAAVTVPCSNTEKGPAVRKECEQGCIGCKLCEKNCEHDAIHVTDNLAAIDYSKCVACGKCAEKCPRKLITLDLNKVKK